MNRLVETPSHTPSRPDLDRWDAVLAAVCFAGGLALYVRTLTHGVLPGDSGEFQTLAYLLGHTHPTGYPIYLVLAKLLTFAPVGEVASRVNLFSACMGALTSAGLYLAGRLLVKTRLLALAGAVALLVSPTFWSQAIIAEVYTPGAAFLILIVAALLWWERAEDPRLLFLAGLLGGLSLGVHMTVALLAPAVGLFLIARARRGKSLWRAAFLGAVTGLALTVLVFWLIDLRDYPANYFDAVVAPSRSGWGLDAGDIDGPWERLLFGWTARQFRAFMFSDIAQVMPEQAAIYWENLPSEFGWPLIGFAGVGIVALLIRRPRAGLLLGVGLATQLLYTFNYAIWDLQVFFIPSYVLLALLAIAGMGTAFELVWNVLGKVHLLGKVRWLPLAAEGAAALAVVGLVIWPVFSPHWAAVRAGEVPFRSGDAPGYDETWLLVAQAAVTNLPENALVFTDWGPMWPYFYVAHILLGRTDLMFIETYPVNDAPGLADSTVDYVLSQLETRPIFFSKRDDALLAYGLRFAPARFGPTRFLRVFDDRP